MAVLVGLGAVLIVAGNVIFYNDQFVIDRLTSRSLGSLAPGYAASHRGMRVYAFLIVCIGLTVGGVGLASWFLTTGVIAVAVGVFGFVVFSVLAIVGEVRTYRALKR